MFVKVTAYQNYLVIEATEPKKKTNDWVPIGNGSIGCVVINTHKHLGISDEALELLKQVKKGRDDIGDIDFFKTAKDGKGVFCWIGDTKRCIEINSKITGSSTYEAPTPEFYNKIPNDVPEDFLKELEEKKKKTRKKVAK